MYLWTFSRTSVRGRKTPADFTRESFSSTLMGAYKECYPDNPVVQFFTARERHAAGTDEQRDWHFHTVAMAETVHRWAPIKNYLLDYEHIAVHASCTHEHYYTAFRYLILPSPRKPRNELDDTPHESPGHPSRREAGRAPRTAAASRARSKDGRKRGETATIAAHNAVVAQRMQGDGAVAEFDEFATAELHAGRPMLAEFVHRTKDLRGFIQRVWAMENAHTRVERMHKTRVELLADAASSKPCVCGGLWTPIADQTLTRSGISKLDFARKVYNLLEIGNMKGRNLFLHGPTNAGKSHLFGPLENIFDTFVRWEQSATMPFEKLPDAEIVLLQDFRHRSGGHVSWDDLLVLFEGGTVQVAVKNSVAHKYKVGQPVFITAKAKLHHQDDREVSQMNTRFDYLYLAHTCPEGEVRDCAHCGACFARFILANLSAAAGPADLQASQASQASVASSGCQFCPHCGRQVSDAGWKYCPECGQDLPM